MDNLSYKACFPLLSDVEKKKTSECDDRYNCIAWAFGDVRKPWWPNTKRCYWPVNAAGKPRLKAFEELFAIWGWSETTDVTPEHGIQKVALYALFGEPTHAARLLPNGLWTSKLGQDIDLIHNELSELTGPLYGTVYKIYKK